MVRKDPIFMSDLDARKILDKGFHIDDSYLRELVYNVLGDKDYADGLNHQCLLREGRTIMRIAKMRIEGLELAAKIHAKKENVRNRRNYVQQEFDFEKH